MGYQVKQTPKSNDFGADLILEDKDRRIAVQAKRFKNKVGVKAVQENNSARQYYRTKDACIFTNSYFTEPAKELAQSNSVALFDRNALIDLIIKVKDEEPSNNEKTSGGNKVKEII